MDSKSNAAPASTPETTEQTIARLTAENANLQRAVAGRAADLTIGLSKDTGVVMLKGLGRWPVSLYPDQWVKVLALAPKITTFIREHAVELEQIRLVRAAEKAAK